MIFDINTLYAKYDSSGTGSIGATISYYGYLQNNPQPNPGISDTSNSFSLKAVYTVGGVQYTSWANNGIGDYECSWSNRQAYFATPSNIGVVSGTQGYYNGTQKMITFTWSAASGASRYSATINNGSILVYNLADASSYIPNANNNMVRNHVLINQTSVTLYNVATGSTYILSVYPYNGVGQGNTLTYSVSV